MANVFPLFIMLRLSAKYMRNTVVNNFCYFLFSLLLSVLQLMANSMLSKNSAVCKYKDTEF